MWYIVLFLFHVTNSAAHQSKMDNEMKESNLENEENKQESYSNQLREKDEVHLSFVGDISFDSVVKYYQKKRLCSYNKTLEHVAPYLREADLVIGNLESPFITPDMEVHAQDGYGAMLGVDASAVEALRFSGFDILSLANNHLNDYRDKPVNYTIDILRKAGLDPFGYTFGTVEENQSQVPIIKLVNQVRIGFLGYCSSYGNEYDTDGEQVYYCARKRQYLDAGPALYDELSVSRDVTRLKNKVDIIVVVMHWGIEYYTVPTSNQLRESRFLQKLGVDIVVGCHAHVPGGHTFNLTSPHPKLVSYSLGNFLFGPRNLNWVFYRHNEPNKESLDRIEKHLSSTASDDPTLQSRILRVKISRKRIASASYLPLKITFDIKSKCLQPKPLKNAKWIPLCSNDDNFCLE